MTDPTPQDDLPDLGPAFRLPAEIFQNEPDLVRLYRQWVERLRSESLGLPMHTVQTFLLERIASMYVILKYREIHGGWVGVNAQKDYTAQWLDVVKEWNKVLAVGQDQLRDAVIRDAEQIAVDALSMVEDTETRQSLRRFFKERYAALGY